MAGRSCTEGTRVKSRTAGFVGAFFWGCRDEEKRSATVSGVSKDSSQRPSNVEVDKSAQDHNNKALVEDNRRPREPQQAHFQGLKGVKSPGAAP